MVPGSTFIYGSSFIIWTLSPRASSKQPIELAASPLPRLETTPPVTNMYLVICFVGRQLLVVRCPRLSFRLPYLRVSSSDNGLLSFASRPLSLSQPGDRAI